MKISQNKLEEFYKKLFSIYVEWEKSETGINSYWNDKRYCLYQSGPVVGKYRENDPELLEIIECNYCKKPGHEEKDCWHKGKTSMF